MDPVVAAEPVEHLGEERVRLAVVERDVGRRPDDDDDPLVVDAEPAQRLGVGLEVVEVVLLLQARIGEVASPAVDPEAAQPLERHRVGEHHPPASRQPIRCWVTAYS